jgi:holliday junction DNA helicase RuvA
MTIAYLRGTPISTQTINNNRTLLVLEVNNIGYELQIPQRMAETIALKTELQIFTHQQVREDSISLYGFTTVPERDLFRQLIGVSGIGASLAIALLDRLELPELVRAIVASDIKTLATTPGVGKKTAERLALELRTQLDRWREASGLESMPAVPDLNRELQTEVEMTLLALGYSKAEITKGLHAIGQDGLISKSTNIEDWLRLAISSIE